MNNSNPNAGARTFLSAATFEQPLSIELPRHCQTKGGSFPSIVCLGNTPFQRSVSVSLPEGHAKLAQALACCPNPGARPFQAAATFKHTVSLEFRHIRSVDGCTFPSSLRLGNTPFNAGVGPSNQISPEGTTDHRAVQPQPADKQSTL